MKRLFAALLLATTLTSGRSSQVIFNQAVGKRSSAAGHFDKNGCLHVVIQGDSLGRHGSNEKQWRYLYITNNHVIDQSFEAPPEARIMGVLATTPETVHVIAFDKENAPMHLVRSTGQWQKFARVPLDIGAPSPFHCAAAIVSDGTIYYFYLNLREAERDIIHCSIWQPLQGWSKLRPVNSGEQVRSLACAGNFRSQRPALGWITMSEKSFIVSEFDPSEVELKLQRIQIPALTALVLYKPNEGLYALTISDLLKTNWERQQTTLQLYQVGRSYQVQNGFTLTNHFPSKTDRPCLGRDGDNQALVWTSLSDEQPKYEAPRSIFYSMQHAAKWSEPRKLNFKDLDHLGIKILDSFQGNRRFRIGVFWSPSKFTSSLTHNSRVEVIEIDGKPQRE